MEILIVLVIGAVGLVIGLALVFGAIAAWPISIVLGMIGFFLGGPTGALIGMGIAGAIGLLAVSNSYG